MFVKFKYKTYVIIFINIYSSFIFNSIMDNIHGKLIMYRGIIGSKIIIITSVYEIISTNNIYLKY